MKEQIKITKEIQPVYTEDERFMGTILENIKHAIKNKDSLHKDENLFYVVGAQIEDLPQLIDSLDDGYTKDNKRELKERVKNIEKGLISSCDKDDVLINVQVILNDIDYTAKKRTAKKKLNKKTFFTPEKSEKLQFQLK
jgi:hypothetical protein